ncbi:MAG: LuxR C-terminal-related transcriptional regulator [Cytophagales bacterium]|nr:LuxR C-terminal-related transcriptional regulator [Cytophagales bacterium]
MKRTIFIFGSLSATLFLLFELGKLSLVKSEGFQEIFLVLSGVAFVVVGFLLGGFFRKSPKKRILKPSQLSKQELKVLNLINEGFSNHEIAEQLFIDKQLKEQAL